MNTELLRQLSRELRTVIASGCGDGVADQPGPSLRPFVQRGRLVSLPAQQSRRHAVLEHIARSSFDENAGYAESAVNDTLRAWCAGGRIDHVALRRYLVESAILVRTAGVYALVPA